MIPKNDTPKILTHPICVCLKNKYVFDIHLFYRYIKTLWTDIYLGVRQLGCILENKKRNKLKSKINAI